MSPGALGARCGVAARQVRREVELLDVGGAEGCREARLLVGVDDDGVDRDRNAAMSCRSPGWPSCGRTLCAMTTERGPRPVVDVRPTPAARRTAGGRAPRRG